MKEKIQKISVTLVMAICELVIGILLLVDPAGLSNFAYIALGAALIILGLVNVWQYIRLPLEDAVKTWKLAIGLGLIAIGISGILNQNTLGTILGTMTTLYAIILMLTTFMKLQMSVDALRLHRNKWYLLCFSFLISAALSVVMFLQPFPAEKTLWIVTGIGLILAAMLDGVYYIIRNHGAPAK